MINALGVSQATKLAEAFERLNTLTGAGLRSFSGPSAAPAQELIRAFREALEAPQVSENSMAQDSGSDAFAFPKTDGKNAVQNDSVHVADENSEPHAAQTDAIGRPLPGARTEYRINKPDMRFTPETGQSTDVQNARLNAGVDLAPQDTFSLTNRKAMPSAVAGMEKNNNRELIQELTDTLDAVFSKGNINHADLYKLQILTGVLSAHASTGNNATQRMEEGLEQLLRQSG